MPWSSHNLPDSAKNLTDKQKEIFVEVANSMLEDGESESAAIAGGISQAKKLTEKSMTKKEQMLNSFSEWLDKHFGDVSSESEGDYEGIAKSVDIEKQHFTSVVLRPDVADLHGDVYSPEVVEDACHNYNEVCRKANLQHLVDTELATPIESYIAKSDFPLGNGYVKKGDWIMTMKIKDSELWNMCKEGKFTGFSVGCMASTEKIK